MCSSFRNCGGFFISAPSAADFTLNGSNTRWPKVEGQKSLFYILHFRVNRSSSQRGPPPSPAPKPNSCPCRWTDQFLKLLHTSRVTFSLWPGVGRRSSVRVWSPPSPPLGAEGPAAADPGWSRPAGSRHTAPRSCCPGGVLRAGGWWSERARQPGWRSAG